jgi:hypothetical protein
MGLRCRRSVLGRADNNGWTMTQERNECTVDFAEDQFEIRCPVWFNDTVRDVPAVRFHKGKKAWVAKPMRQNVAALEKLKSMRGVTFSMDAIAAMTFIEASATVKTGQFPAWYPFKRQPKAHQRPAYDKLYPKQGGLLGMEMQTGKSKIAVDLAACWRMEGIIDHVLVLTKRSLRANWIGHFEKDCAIPFLPFLPDTDDPKAFNMWLTEQHDFKVMIVGWESLSQGKMASWAHRFLDLCMKPAVIGDETTFIINHKSIRTKHTIDYGRKATKRLALAGEPHLEGPMNLFAQFEYIDPQIIGIGDFYAFRNRYAVMGGFMREVRPGKKVATDIVGYQNLDELAATLEPYTYDVRKGDAVDMPPKLPEVRTVQLTKTQKDLLLQIKRDSTFTVEGDPEVVMQNVLETALRRHQIVGGYAVRPREVRRTRRDGTEVVRNVFDPITVVAPAVNPKIQELLSLVEDIRGKHQFLVWAVYMPEIQHIIEALSEWGLKVGPMHGQVPEGDRQIIVDDFNKGDLDCIVGNASTGGMGFTMDAATVNIFYSNTFKAIDRVQAEDRPWGITQTKPVTIVDIVAEQSIDVTILRALEDKQDLSTFIRQRIRDAKSLLDGDL